MDTIKNIKDDLHETNSVRYGPSDSCQMVLPEAVEVQASHLTMTVNGKGLPQSKIEKIKFVLKCFFGNIKCIKIMLLFFSRKKMNNEKSVQC